MEPILIDLVTGALGGVAAGKSSPISQVIAGGAGGAILMAIIGATKNKPAA
jgi:hypothetical protein